MSTGFRFQIGDLVSHKLDPRTKGLVLGRRSVETSYGIELTYDVRVTNADGIDGRVAIYQDEELTLYVGATATGKPA